MADCFFCGAFVGEVNGDGGLKGRTIGNKDVCEQCLGELKHWLNATLPRSPSMRTTPLKEEDDESEEVETDEEPIDEINEEQNEEDNPFSSKPKV
jgi:hypothetical protein